ncbi:hypothetical protein Scep_015060 [Stephania cephalantha]|uniref:Uncharacterized protein n=1 Tax=Stephania cephalantha TaxID=152367 RepID=A0AAP0J2H3_9MAGN
MMMRSSCNLNDQALMIQIQYPISMKVMKELRKIFQLWATKKLVQFLQWSDRRGTCEGSATNDGDRDSGRREAGTAGGRRQQGSRDGGGREAGRARDGGRRRGRKGGEDGGGGGNFTAGRQGTTAERRRGRWRQGQASTTLRARTVEAAPWRGTATGEAGTRKEAGRGTDGRIADLGEQRRWGRKANRDEGFGWFKVAWKS